MYTHIHLQFFLKNLSFITECYQVFTNMNKDVISNFEHIYHLPTEDRLQELVLLDQRVQWA